MKAKNYSYSAIDIKNDLKAYVEKRRRLVKNFLKNHSEKYCLEKFNEYCLNIAIPIYKNKNICTKDKLIKIIIYYKNKRNFRNSDDKIIHFLQKRFEINRNISEVYDNKLEKVSSFIRSNKIDTISLLAYVLLLKFNLNKNYSYLSTSLKISDFIKHNFKKNIINKSLIAINMYLNELKIINQIIKYEDY